MSETKVELLQRIYEQWTRDREIDRNLFHPEFEIRTPITRLENRTRRGYDGYRAWRAATSEVATEDWFEPVKFVDLGDEVLVEGRFHFKGKASGAASSDRMVQLWTFTDGRPASMTAARTLAEAREASKSRD
jgi:ketosteroid isomerase-like protein